MAVEGFVLWYRPSGKLGGTGFIEVRAGNSVQQFYFRRYDIVDGDDVQQALDKQKLYRAE